MPSPIAESPDPETIFAQLFLTPEGRAEPYPLYHRLRQAAPVHRSQLGIWVLSRYDDCWAALRDPRLGKDYARQTEQRFGADWRKHPALTVGEHAMLNTGGPEHTRLRKLVTKSFTPRTIESLKPTIAKVVSQLLDPLAEARGGDILAGVGFPLPIAIIGELLGIPAADHPQFQALVYDLVAILEMRPTDSQLAAADTAQLTINDYFLQLIAEKRRKDSNDLLGNLTRVEVAGDRLTDDELVTLATLLFAAGFEATTNLIGNGLLGLLRHPDQIALLRSDDALFANLADELLRYDGTAQLVSRFSEASIDLGGVTIPAGEQVFALLGAANHDPARFADPDRLDVTRTEIHPLSFGGGVHFCLGAALARAEIEITFRSLLQRFDSIELNGAPPRFHDRLTLRGLETLQVACRVGAGPRAVASAPVVTPVALPQLPGVPEMERGQRPRLGESEADLRWRAELRQRIETEPTRDDSVPTRTGDRLAAMVTLLKTNRLFARCSDVELEDLAATAYPMTFEPGDVLCTEGSQSQECYIIEEGQALVSIGSKGVGSVAEHDVVGERGVLLDTARAATVTAISHMITYAISRQRLRALVTANPAARQWMLDEIRRRYPNLA